MPPTQLLKPKQPARALALPALAPSPATAWRIPPADLFAETVPTVGFNTPTILKRRGAELRLYDLGGGARFREVWTQYFHDVHGAVFVVDSGDTHRLEEAKAELHAAAAHPMLEGKPLLILANKQDLASALTNDELSRRLDVAELSLSRHSVQPCVCKPAAFGGQVDERIWQGADWLVDSISADWGALSERMERETAEFKEADAKRRAAALAALTGEGKAEQPADGDAADKPATSASPAPDDVVLCVVKHCGQPAERRCQAAGWQAVCERCGTALEAGETQAELEQRLAAGDGSAPAATSSDAPSSPARSAGVPESKSPVPAQAESPARAPSPVQPAGEPEQSAETPGQAAEAPEQDAVQSAAAEESAPGSQQEADQVQVVSSPAEAGNASTSTPPPEEDAAEAAVPEPEDDSEAVGNDVRATPRRSHAPELDTAAEAGNAPESADFLPGAIQSPAGK